MRRRTDEELNSPERMRKLAANPSRTPRVIREHIRDHYVMKAVRRLFRIGMGIETFEVPVFGATVKGEGKADGTEQQVTSPLTVNVPASASVQRAALAEVLKYGLPAQVGLADDEGNSVSGVVALPTLALGKVQQRIQSERAPALPAGEPGSEDEQEGEEYIEIPTEESDE